MIAEKIVKDIVTQYGPLTTRSIAKKTDLKKPVINTILHQNRNYRKVYRSHSIWSRPIWSWSNTKVPLPAKAKIRVDPSPVHENTVAL
jgi:hypothetical protein